MIDGPQNCESGSDWRIGLMQGRLLPPIGGRIQSFPGTSWREEFQRASDLGLHSIEWIVESPLESNPMWTAEGIAAIREAIERYRVAVDFVIADYFMESPLVRMSAVDFDRNQAVLGHLIEQAGKLEVKGIEIPCVDSSAIETPSEEDELARALESVLDRAKDKGLQIGLETSLAPGRFRGLLEKIGHESIRANYDTGNSAALGYDVAEEVEAYGRWINNVHIKDRKRGGGTVPLGSGDTDIVRALTCFERIHYKGDFILQGARTALGEVETVTRYQRQVSGWIRSVRKGKRS